MAIISNCTVCGSTFERSGQGSHKVRTCSKACLAEHKRGLASARLAASKKKLPTANEVRALLSYDPTSGLLTWRPRPGNDQFTTAWNAKHVNKQVGSLRKRGYVSVAIFGRNYLAHRLIFLIVTGAWPGGFDVDHKDGNPSNNVFSNLRLASRSMNNANARRHSDSQVGLKGVDLTRKGRYRARIKADGKERHLGEFDTPEEAHRAYVEAAKKYHGEFARVA